VNLAHPANPKALAYLARCHSDSRAFAAWDSIENPHYRCGCHPEIVERLWDQLGATLPRDSRG
jgi:hypothetical protein